MAARTAAQEEFDTLVSRASRGDRLASHREDRHYNEEDKDEEDDESRYRQEKIDEAMRTPVFDNGLMGRLPPRAFDDGKATGVKGVIADARNYVESKREGWRSQSVPGRKTSPSRSRINKSNAKGGEKQGDGHRHHSDSDGEEDEDEEFLSQWREARRRELLLGEGTNGAAGGNDIRNKRRTSPSLRRFGRFDEVDAVGYLDAIEKVGRETVVVVFVYDDASAVSQVIEDALSSLVPVNPLVHFVKVSYDEIEFDSAAVPAILAYRNQGDLFANLTYVIDEIPEEVVFDSDALRGVLVRHGVL